jgi:hypothetical protein
MVACCDSELDCITPLFLAVTTGDLAKVRQALICTNPNISAGGMRPLHIAAWNGYLEIVELLLEHARIQTCKIMMVGLRYIMR